MAILQLLIKIMVFIKISIVLSFLILNTGKPTGAGCNTSLQCAPLCHVYNYLFFFKNKAKCHQTLTCQNVFETPTFRTTPAIF